jgi:hypothetical protein
MRMQPWTFGVLALLRAAGPTNLSAAAAACLAAWLPAPLSKAPGKPRGERTSRWTGRRNRCVRGGRSVSVQLCGICPQQG